MAMATVNSPHPAIGHLLTRKQMKRALWVGGRHRSSVTGLLDGASGYVLPSSGNLVRIVVYGRRSTGSSCSCGLAARGLMGVQGRGSKNSDSDRRWRCAGSSEGSGNSEGDLEGAKQGEDEEVDQALNLDGQIPMTSDGFLKQVSSNAYDLRRQLEQNIESSSYDVLEANPWRETPKPVYVLAQEENRLLTMRTRRARSEVEKELGMLFPKRGSRRGRQKRPSSKSRDDESTSSSGSDGGLRMLVEDIREGVLVFEDEEEATRYCSLLDGQGKGCAGVAELDASDVFAVCQKTQRLAVLFRRGTTPPQPDRLQLNLKARKRSLED